MSEAENNTQVQTSRMSKVAIWSLVIPLLLCIGSLSFYTVFRSGVSETLEVCLFLFPSAGFCLSPLTFILGIWGIVRVAKSKGALKGYIPASLGVIVTVFCLHCSLVGVACVRPQARIEQCKILLMEIGKAMASYSNDYNGQYPTAERWNHLLIEHYGLDEEFFTPLHGRYALNPDARPDSAADVVLVFEVKSEWDVWYNQFGGPERLAGAIHHIPTILLRKSITGCNVLFNDGHVEFIKTEEAGELKWKEEEK